jgi:sec-independent protein translocase protein TatB
MFDFSLGELMVTAAVALVVIGPEKLPKVARTVGALLGRAQRYVHNVKQDLQRDIQLDELRQANPLEELQRLKNDLHHELQEGLKGAVPTNLPQTLHPSPEKTSLENTPALEDQTPPHSNDSNSNSSSKPSLPPAP